MSKKPQTDTRARPKKCLSNATDRDHGVVTNMAGSHAQHAQLKFSNEFEQFRSFQMHFLGPDEQMDKQTDGHTHIHTQTQGKTYTSSRCGL